MSPLNEYAIHGGQAGNKRLAILSRALQSTTNDFMNRYAASIQGQCLDLGCGGGSVTLNIARLAKDKGEVMGTDIDPVNVSLATALAKQQRIENVQFSCSNAYQLVAVQQYAFIYSRFLLSHLKRPAQVVASIFRGLAPGGRLLLEDTDFAGHFCHPPCEAFEAYVQLYQDLLHSRGANANLGPGLYQLLLQAGFKDVSVQVVQPVHTVQEGKLMAEITMAGISGALEEEGLATQKEISQTLAQLKAFRVDEKTLMSLPRIFQVSAVKPK